MAAAIGLVGYQFKDSIHLDGPHHSVTGLQIPHDEMERQVREAQKSQTNGANFALLALTRSTTIAKAVALCVWDYRSTLGKKYASREEEAEELRQCHLRSAHRILIALQTNGGLYVKLGQHISAVILLPTEWTATMRPLQDQNRPTPLPELEAMFRNETGMTFDEAFSEIDPKPIGVASLAQVHRAVDRKTGQALAIKMMHPDVERFSEVDMKTVTVLVKWVKRLLPDFSFEWLADEMNENMPLEMDFRHEAQNAKRAEDDFADYRTTSVYIPKVKYVFKRVMAMEFIDGRRPTICAILHSTTLTAIASVKSFRASSRKCFTCMASFTPIHMAATFSSDRAPGSRSRYNFEVVLLDHGCTLTLTSSFAPTMLASGSPAQACQSRSFG